VVERGDDDHDGDEDGLALAVPCPGCKTLLGVGQGVERFKCPSCGKRLELVERNPEEPADDAEPRGVWLGVKQLGRRHGRVDRVPGR
jgi:LSD1 subclass zinc finger protein